MAYTARTLNPDGTRDVNVTDVYGAGDTLDWDYRALPLDPERTALIHRTMAAAFPGHPYEIVGGLWDYQNPANEREGEVHPFKELPIGDYRIRFTEDPERPNIIIRATKHMSQDALEIEHAVFKAYAAEGIPCQEVLKDDQGRLMLKDERAGVKIHFIQHIPIADFPDNKNPETYVGRYLPALGVFIAKLQRAGQQIDPAIRTQMTGYTDDTTLAEWKRGFKISEGTDGDETLAATFDRIRFYGGKALQNEYCRNVNALALVAKNVPANKQGELQLASQINASRGSLPMMAERVPYDLAFAATRHILINPCQMEDEHDLAKAMQSLLDGYNKEMGTNIPVTELTEAMRRQISADVFQVLDQTQTAGGSYKQNLEAHAEAITKREIERLNLLDRIDALYGAPKPAEPAADA